MAAKRRADSTDDQVTRLPDYQVTRLTDQVDRLPGYQVD